METEIDLAFSVLEHAAIHGERCPQSTGPHAVVPSSHIIKLAQDGRLKIEVYGRNYRVVEILSGPHKGRRTAAAPVGMTPWRVIDKDGTHYPHQDEKFSFREPSPPRLLQPSNK